MAGIKALRKIQFGKETTPGTAVAATTLWRGMGLLEDGREIKFVEEQIGVATSTTRNYIPKLAASVKFDPVEATFKQLPYIFEAGIKAETPAQDGAGTGYLYDYVFPTTAQNTIRTYTIEGGDNQLVQETDYAFVEKFKLSGNAAEGVMMEADWIGRDVVDTTFTAAIAGPTLAPADHILFGGSLFYIDATSGTIGTTAVSNTLLSFELDVTTGLKAKWTNLGKDFDFVYFDGGSFNATLKVVYEHNSTADAQRDLYEVGTARQFRLRFIGKTLTTPGAYTTEILNIDAVGVYTSFKSSDKDGNSTNEVEIKIGYDEDPEFALGFLVVNQLSALP